MATKRASKAVSTHYEIQVDVDKKGRFTYTASGGANGASLLTRRMGDTISWSVRLKGKKTPFQVEFDGNGPFGYDQRVIRSSGKATPPLTVNVPASHEGSYVMKYRVTVAEGWSDDPDVVPILSDGDIGGLTAPKIIQVSDDGKGGLSITPQNAAATINAPVIWTWSGTPLGEYVLTFDDPPPGWPTRTQSQGLKIALTFPVAGKNEPYGIKLDESTLVGAGKLTIS